MSRNPPVLALGGVAAALLGVLAFEIFVPGSEHPPPTARTVAPVVAPPAPVLAALSPALVDTILARPLFMASRRPPAAPAAPAAGRAPGLPRLTGVLSSSSGKRLIFAPGPDGKPVVVAEGGHIGAYEVRSIGAGEAIVLGPEGLKTLHPAFDATNPSNAGINPPGGATLTGPADRNAVLELMGAATRNGAQAAPPGGVRTKTMVPRPAPATTPGLQP